MKRTLPHSIFACLAVLLSAPTVLYADGAGYGGAAQGRGGLFLDIHGYVTNDRALVPLRGLAAWLGADVGYTGGVITVRTPGRRLVLRPGQRRVEINGTSRSIDAPPRLLDGQLLVPLRVVAEGLGAKVQYRGDDNKLLEGLPGVDVRRGDRSGHVALHRLSPALAAQLVDAAKEWDYGRYGLDWMLSARTRAGAYAYAVILPWDDGMREGYEKDMAFFVRRQGRWRPIAHRRHIPPALSEFRAWGISRDTLRQLGFDPELLRETDRPPGR